MVLSGLKVRTNFVLKWTGCIFILIGAILTSINVYPLNLFILNLGTIFYVLWSYRVKEPSVFVVNLGLFIIYLIGSIHAG